MHPSDGNRSRDRSNNRLILSTYKLSTAPLPMSVHQEVRFVATSMPVQFKIVPGQSSPSAGRTVKNPSKPANFVPLQKPPSSSSEIKDFETALCASGSPSSDWKAAGIFPPPKSNRANDLSFPSMAEDTSPTAHIEAAKVQQRNSPMDKIYNEACPKPFVFPNLQVTATPLNNNNAGSFVLAIDGLSNQHGQKDSKAAQKQRPSSCKANGFYESPTISLPPSPQPSQPKGSLDTSLSMTLKQILLQMAELQEENRQMCNRFSALEEENRQMRSEINKLQQSRASSPPSKPTKDAITEKPSSPAAARGQTNKSPKQKLGPEQMKYIVKILEPVTKIPSYPRNSFGTNTQFKVVTDVHNNVEESEEQERKRRDRQTRKQTTQEQTQPRNKPQQPPFGQKHDESDSTSDKSPKSKKTKKPKTKGDQDPKRSR